MERWDGRVALVTGASDGLGAELCKVLVTYGITVVGCASDAEKVRALSQDKDVAEAKGKIHPIRCDLSKDSEIHAMFAEIFLIYGHIDICINNPGFYIETSLLDGRAEDWRKMLQVNIIALGLVTREAVKLMGINNAEGQVINISSLGNRIVSRKDQHLYVFCGTKFTIQEFTQGIRGEIKLIKPHIRVTSVSPRMVPTEFLARSFHGPETHISVHKQVKSVAPKDIAEVVVYILTSPKEMDITSLIVKAMDEKTVCI